MFDVDAGVDAQRQRIFHVLTEPEYTISELISELVRRFDELNPRGFHINESKGSAIYHSVRNRKICGHSSR